MSERDPYVLGYRQVERERLVRQSYELAPESAALFDRIGVGAGWRAIEIGCGPRGCLELLSRRVGPTGRVVGVERNAEEVLSARRCIADESFANVEVIEGDARATGLSSGSFDLATARLVLVNVPRPEEIVAEMVRLVRPGGFVALQEPESTTQRCDPPHPAQVFLLELLRRYAERLGADRSIGLRLHRLLRAAGLVDVEVHAFAHVYPHGHARRMLLLEFVENARERVLAEKLVGERELEEATAALRRHLEDPETLVLSALFLQAWGRVPNRAGSSSATDGGGTS